MVPKNLPSIPPPIVFPTPKRDRFRCLVGHRTTPRLAAPSHRLRLLIAALPLALGCAKREAPNANDAVVSAPAAEIAPPVSVPELRDDTPNVLLTWLDEKGDFSVGEKLSEVPEASKAQVRVVFTTSEQGTGQTVLVADLRNKNADGTYTLKTMSRAEWNELGASRRKVRMEALAPSVASSTTDDATAPDQTNASGPTTVKAVVYGASWCKPCHDAEALLKKLGVDVVKKDIEQSQAAHAEMQQKLMNAGRGGASIPVIDVAGQLFVGFEPNQLKQAVERARKAIK